SRAASLGNVTTRSRVSERARPSGSWQAGMPTTIPAGAAAPGGGGGGGIGVGGRLVVSMRTALSGECGRAAGGRPGRRGARGPVDCSGGRTRDRLGPRSVTAVGGRDTIGREPVAASAGLVATLLALRTRREVVER